MRWRSRRFGVLLCAVPWLGQPLAGSAVVCTVPSAPYPTLQSAIDDAGCSQVSISSGTFVEELSVPRSLSLFGVDSGTSVLEGRLHAFGGGVELTLADLTIDAGAPSVVSCLLEALAVDGGASLTSTRDLVVLHAEPAACRLSADGFESGDTSNWSAHDS